MRLIAAISRRHSDDGGGGGNGAGVCAQVMMCAHDINFPKSTAAADDDDTDETHYTN